MKKNKCENNCKIELKIIEIKIIIIIMDKKIIMK